MIPSRYMCVLTALGRKSPYFAPSGKWLHPSWDLQLVTLGTHSKCLLFRTVLIEVPGKTEPLGSASVYQTQLFTE